MRKLLMLMVAALALTGWSFTQDQDNAAKPQDQDNAAKQDMKKAGKDTKDAAKATGRGVKHGAKWTKDKVTGDDKDKDRVPQSDRDANADRDRAADRDANRDRDAVRDRDADRNRNVDNDRDRDAARDRDANANRNTSAFGSNASSVHITNGPNVNPSSNSANINWNTNKNAATDVWLMGPGIRGHRVQYERGGSTNHSVSFSNLKPNTTYRYEIRTREGGDRKQGTFTTK